MALGMNRAAGANAQRAGKAAGLPAARTRGLRTASSSARRWEWGGGLDRVSASTWHPRNNASALTLMDTGLLPLQGSSGARRQPREHDGLSQRQQVCKALRPYTAHSATACRPPMA